MNPEESQSQNTHREGEAPAEPPQPQSYNYSIAPPATPRALSPRSERGHREGEAPAEPPQLHTLHYPDRARPLHGIHVPLSAPVIVFVTVCTKNRERWLAQPHIHMALCRVWQKAHAWRVGRYVIMPDHIHLFAAWIDGAISLERWVQFWKSQFTKSMSNRPGHWQSGHWDTRMRGVESYESKWEYVRNNPVRHKLVARAEDWPYQGEMYSLDWN